MSDNTPLSEDALGQLFRNARTYNGYKDKPVSEDQLRQIWDLTKMGPTSANQLPARIVWCVSQDAKDRLAKLCMPGNADKVRSAPATAIIGMDVDFHEHLPWLFPHADMKPMFDDNLALRELSAMRNSSLQGGYFIMAARALGLDTGPMSGFDNDGVDKEFFADTPSVKSNFISTLGYGDDSTIYPRSPRPDFDTFNTIA